MKPQLQRIETALQHLVGKRPPPPPSTDESRGLPPRLGVRSNPAPPPRPITPPPAATGLPSMRSRSAPNNAPPPHWAKANPPPRPAPSSPSFDLRPQSPQHQTPPPPPANPQASQITHVPAGPLNQNHRQVNPALATNLLREIEAVIVGWQRELKQILMQIQNLYLEGPMVDGWLECQDPDPTKTLPPNARAQIEANYGNNVSYEFPRPGYRLCGRDREGRIWSKACPPQQVASVSMAIARYQKLRQLLKKKHNLEQRLSQIAETLVLVHSRLKA